MSLTNCIARQIHILKEINLQYPWHLNAIPIESYFYNLYMHLFSENGTWPRVYMYCKHNLGFSMRFIHCPTAHKVWKYLSKVLRVLTLDPLLFETYTMGLFYSFSYDPNDWDGDNIPVLSCYYWRLQPNLGYCVMLLRLIVGMELNHKY